MRLTKISTMTLVYCNSTKVSSLRGTSISSILDYCTQRFYETKEVSQILKDLTSIVIL